MRLLGVDLGSKRIGIAVGEKEAGVVTPRPALAAVGTLRRDADAVAALARREEADAIVLGLPVELSGEEGRMARVCRTFAGHLADLGLTVHLVDETFTSVAAEAAMRQVDMKASQRRKARDGEAAAQIVERFIHAQADQAAD